MKTPPDSAASSERTSKRHAYAAHDPAAVQAHYRAVLDAMNAAVLDHHTRRDFSQVFEKYMHA